MDSNKDKSLLLWKSIDSFWSLVKNKSEIGYIWQTMYACVEELESVYRSFGRMAVKNMPDSYVIKNVVFDITNTSGLDVTVAVSKLSYADVGMTSITSIPTIKTEINSDTEYLEGIDYTIEATSSTELTIHWEDTAHNTDGTYYVPSVFIANPNIELYGGMYWDSMLRDTGLSPAKRKDIYHSLLLSSRNFLTKSCEHNTMNIIAGAEYAKLPGKITKNSEEVSISYVNQLYLIRHNGTVFGGESMTEFSNIYVGESTVDTDNVTIKVGDVISFINDINATISAISEEPVVTINTRLKHGIHRVSFDMGKSYEDVTIDGDKLYTGKKGMKVGDSVLISGVTAQILNLDDIDASATIDINIPADDYRIKVLDCVPATFNDCYALYGETVLSCFYDNLPNYGPYSVSHALNYVLGTGFNINAETFACTPEDATVENNQYVDIYTPINSVLEIYDWKKTGDVNKQITGFRCDDYIMKNYLNQSCEWYHGSGTVSDHDLIAGDSITIKAGYYMQYPITAIDSYTITVPGSFDIGDNVVDMYGDPARVTVNFRNMEKVVVINGTGQRCVSTILSGEYNDQDDTITLKMVDPISITSPTHIRQSFESIHKHNVVSVDEVTGEIVTDRTLVYGEYAQHVKVVGKKSKDSMLRKHIHSITSQTDNGDGTYTLQLGADNPILAQSPDIPGSTTAAVWSEKIGVLYLPVMSIDTNNNTITVTYTGEYVLTLSSLIYSGGYYTRNKVHIKTTCTNDDILSIIERLMVLVIPAGYSIQIHKI